jgi:hypothetical protein
MRVPDFEPGEIGMTLNIVCGIGVRFNSIWTRGSPDRSGRKSVKDVAAKVISVQQPDWSIAAEQVRLSVPSEHRYSGRRSASQREAVFAVELRVLTRRCISVLPRNRD